MKTKFQVYCAATEPKTPTEPGEEFGEIRYNVEPDEDTPTPTDPKDSGGWFEDY